MFGPKGVILWEKTLVSELYCFIKVIHQTADEGFVLAGTAFAPETDAQICIIKTDKEGNPNWEIPLGRTSSSAMNIAGENRTSVQQTQDGGFIVAGETYPPNAGNPDILLAKIDLNGQVVWEQTFGDYNPDYVYSVQQTPDGGYILAGYTWLSGAGKSETRVMKTDSTGNMLWEKKFSGTSSYYARFLQQTEDGGFIFTGTVYPPNSYDGNVWLVKLDSDGNTIWEQIYGEEATSDRGKIVHQTTDGGYIILGETESYGAGSLDMWLIKSDASGNMVWDKTFGDENQNNGITMQQTIDGGYILLGYTIIPDDNLSSNYFQDIIKTDPYGNIVGKDE